MGESGWYENLAKIKNRRPGLEDASGKGLKEANEYALRSARERNAGEVFVEGEKAGYDMSGMLYDPIFQKITSCTSILDLSPFAFPHLFSRFPVSTAPFAVHLPPLRSRLSPVILLFRGSDCRCLP